MESLSSVVSASRVDTSGWDGGQCGSKCSLEMLCDRNNSNQCDSKTQNTHISKVGGKKRKESAILNKQIIQSETTGGGKM